MSQLPPQQPQSPYPPAKDNTGAVVATAAAGTGILIAIIIAVVAFLLIAFCVIGVLIALLLPAVQAAREAARRAQSMNNVRQIAITLHTYESANGTFPPQFTVDDDGNPLHSWRTLILPFIEQAHVFDQINQEEPWNSANNRALTDVEIPLYRSQRYGDTGSTTNYVVIAGEGFMFNGANKESLRNVQDGTTKTIMLIEIANSNIPWAEPRDLTLDDLQLEDAGASPDTPNVVRRMAIIGFVDGSTQVLETSDPQELRKMLTISGNEAISH